MHHRTLLVSTVISNQQQLLFNSYFYSNSQHINKKAVRASMYNR